MKSIVGFQVRIARGVVALDVDAAEGPAGATVYQEGAPVTIGCAGIVDRKVRLRPLVVAKVSDPR